MRRMFRRLASLLVVTVIVAACSSGGDGGQSASDEQFNDADVEFVQGMIPHHEQAVEMARMASDRAESAAVQDLAERIEAAQGPEIETMEGWLEDWGQSASDEMSGMGHGGSGGMMSDGDMDELEGMSGASFDEMFLTMMIEHHEGAIEMADREVADGQNEEAVALAGAIIETQEAEIEEMDGLLVGAGG